MTQHLKKLNDAQSQSLRDMGFDHLREQQISRVPRKLAWWLLNNFDARSCSLRVQDGKELHITEEDVALTPGFPRGNIIIEKRTKGDEDTTLVEEWKKQLGRTGLSITPTKLCKAMVGCRDGGEWFKRHLAILIATMFVESNLSGYVNTNLIKNFEDVTKIGDLNWCEYIRRTLVSSKVAWKKKTTQKFIGPIIFLTTTQLLNQREKNEISFGGFGYGYIDEPQQPLKAIEERNQQRVKKGCRFAEKIKLLAATMNEVMIMAEEAPQHIVDNPNFKQMVESAQKLLGIPNPEIELTQENEEFLNNPEFIAAFDEIDNAIARREQYRTKIAEGPSFSLGMTPDEVDRVINRVQRTATRSTAKSSQQNVMSDEFNTPTGPSTDTTPNLTQHTTTEDQTQPAEQQENVDEEPQQKESQQIRQDDEEQHPIQMQTEQTPAKEPQTRMERRQVLQNDNVDPTRIIFKHGAYAVIWDDMLSLNKNEEIKVGIIDAWSAILNQKEKARSNSSPCRFFASTFVCVIVAPYGDDTLRSKRFSERMDDEIKRTEGLNLQDIELFVFPIVHSEHYYVLTINVKNKRFDILDNSSAESPKNEKYADVPTTLKTMLADYFHLKEDDAKSKLVRGLTPARLRMSWRDNNNKVDCGVFAMRHMETYMGKGTKGWDCGLEKENKEQLNNTRVKYLAGIVNSPINEFREDCMEDARQFKKASKAKK
nr:uncharacterized protein LOC109155335 [Ipomoea batatas]